MTSLTPLLITSGESAGIGLDILVDIFSNDTEENSLNDALATHPICVLADKHALAARAEQLEKTLVIHDIPDVANTVDYSTRQGTINVHHTPCAETVMAGQLNVANASQVIDQLTLASQLALANKVSAIITAPVQKSVINDAISQGFIDTQANTALKQNHDYFSGHTEFFQHMAACDDVVMMLANDTLKVALVTTHIPLKDVPKAVTKEKLTTVLDILLQDMAVKFGNHAPVIKVCGLNPHAGEGGHMGMEEIQTINPLLESYQQQPNGKHISHCLPADTLFNRQNLASTDCFLAMYHDQGLTVLKALGFGNTVNLTLGLPFIRTSVDHGTALDIAGTGKASASSLLQALKMAHELSLH